MKWNTQASGDLADSGRNGHRLSQEGIVSPILQHQMAERYCNLNSALQVIHLYVTRRYQPIQKFSTDQKMVSIFYDWLRHVITASDTGATNLTLNCKGRKFDDKQSLTLLLS